MIWKRFRQWVEDCWLVIPLLLGLIICTISAAGTSKPRWICAIFGFGIGAVTVALVAWFPTADELNDQSPDHCDAYATYEGECVFCIINGKVYVGKSLNDLSETVLPLPERPSYCRPACNDGEKSRMIPEWFDQYGNHVIDFDSRDSRFDHLQYKPTTYSKGGQA